MQVINRKAKINYKILEKYEAGISLLGSEVKSIKEGKIDINNSFAKIIGNEIFLINANIPITGKKDYSGTRPRKLLLKKNEITAIQSKIKEKKLILIPTRVYNKNRIFKVELALAKVLRKFEIKEKIKKKDIEREIEREIKNYKTLKMGA